MMLVGKINLGTCTLLDNGLRRDVIERRVGEARQVHPTQVVLEGHGQRGVEPVEAETR